MYSSLPQSPSGMGDIIGLSFRIVRRNASAIGRFILLPSLCVFAVAVLLQWAITYGIAGVTEAKSLSGALWLGALFLVVTFVLWLCWWVLGMRLLAIVRLVLGFASDLEQASAYTKKRKWSLLGLNFVIGLIFIPSMLLWLVFFALGMFVAGVLNYFTGPIGSALAVGIMAGASMIFFFVLFGYYVFTNCVFACEDKPVSAILGRAAQLMFSHIVRFSEFCVVFSVVYAVISYPLSLPIIVATIIDTLQHGIAAGGEGLSAGYKPPLYIMAFTQGWETCMSLILRPFMAIGFGLFYYDSCMRSEGLDVRRRLQAIASNGQAAQTPGPTLET